MSGRSGPWTGAPAVRTRALAFAWPEQRAVRRESAASHARRARAECRYSREAIVSEPQALVLVPRRQCRAPRRRCCLRLRLSGNSSDPAGSLRGMGARFIGCDRDQVFLMPPSLRDWVPEGHLVWTVLEAVGELDLSAIYADYHDDGRGRPAYEPSMMVALLLYAYARGNRSSRGIERACVEDVAFRVVTGNLAPDHSTIAE